MEEETRCSTCGTMHSLYMSCGVCKEVEERARQHAWEAEQRRLRANTIVLKREVLQWKTEKGDSWFAKNYLRLLYAFQDDTNDWHEYLEYGLANTLNGEEKRLVDALNKIGHLDKDSFNKLSAEKLKTSQIVSTKTSQDNISKQSINGTLSYLIPFVLCLIFWFTSEWFFVFKILAVVVIFGFCVVIMFPILDLVNGVDENNAGEKSIEPFKKMETERLSFFAFLNDLKQQGKDLRNASLNNKEYLYDTIFGSWNKKEFLLGNNIQNEIDEINKLARKIEQDIDKIFSRSPLCTTSNQQCGTPRAVASEDFTTRRTGKNYLWGGLIVVASLFFFFWITNLDVVKTVQSVFQQTINYSHGSYKGEVVNGKANGAGEYVSKVSGATYSGNFLNDTFNGVGTMRWEDGSKFVGNWKNDVGTSGTMTYPNGITAIGRVVKGKFIPQRK